MQVSPTALLSGKRVLVTGGTGSLGKALVRRILTGELGRPHKVTVFSRDEAKQHDMRLALGHAREATDDVAYRDYRDVLEFRIGDVRDYDSVVAVIRHSDIVFHAAALKQVPSCEYAPLEAVKTNVLGPSNVIRAILSSDCVDAAISISTDKACKPVNVMGMTKALQERVFVTANLGQSRTRFLCVRYGNVISSRGSVVPLFLEQIRRGGPVTITLKHMTRFLLTLDRAVDTVFAALVGGEAGDTYVPKLPAAYVRDIAIALMGPIEVPISYIGIRPGEKVDEIMVSEEEVFRTIERGDYWVIKPILPELGGTGIVAARKTEYSSREVTLDVAGIKRLIEQAGAREGMSFES